MIKAGDLMFGNWVKLLTGYENDYYQVNGLMPNTDRPIHLLGNAVWNTESEIAPVELTPEILGMCTFDKSNYKDLNDNWLIHLTNGIFYIQVEKPDICEYLRLEHINYLHQLQRLYLSLTGVELDVKLPQLKKELLKVNQK